MEHSKVLDRIGPTLALDPGGTTGSCLWIPGDAPPALLGGKWKKFGVGHFLLTHLGEGRDHHDELFEWLNDCSLLGLAGVKHLQPSLVIVCESFEFRKEKDRNKIVYVSAEYIGVVKLFCQMHVGDVAPVKLVMQGASLAKGGFWGGEEGKKKIKSLGLWDPKFYPHGMDALRHFLYYACFTCNDQSVLMSLRQSDGHRSSPLPESLR